MPLGAALPSAAHIVTQGPSSTPYKGSTSAPFRDPSPDAEDRLRVYTGRVSPDQACPSQ